MTDRTFPTPGDRVLLSWSSGKDCAWALHVLRRGGANVVGLLATFNEAFGRVSMHATRRGVVEAQALAAGVPLWPVDLPWPCPNEEYESRMAGAMARAKAEGVTCVAFGDLHLADVRRYREEKLAGVGIAAAFPLWTRPDATAALAGEMLRAGLRAKVSSVDPRQIAPSFAGREYDEAMLRDLPPAADRCGENGEFHTICYAGPMFAAPIPLVPGEVVQRDGFWFADFRLAPREETR